MIKKDLMIEYNKQIRKSYQDIKEKNFSTKCQKRESVSGEEKRLVVVVTRVVDC